MVTAFLKAWVECASRSKVCFLSKIAKFVREQKLTKPESILLALALSMIAAGLVIPGESTAIIDFLFSP